MQSHLLFYRELNLCLLLKQFKQSSAKQGQNTHSLEIPHFVVRSGTEFREAEQVENCVLPSVLTLPKSHFPIRNYFLSVIQRSKSNRFPLDGECKTASLHLGLFVCPDRATTALPALQRKEAHVPREKLWAAPAQALPGQFWGQGTTGFLANKYKSAYRLSSLVWDYFPQIPRGLSYFIANPCDLI